MRSPAAAPLAGTSKNSTGVRPGRRTISSASPRTGWPAPTHARGGSPARYGRSLPTRDRSAATSPGCGRNRRAARRCSRPSGRRWRRQGRWYSSAIRSASGREPPRTICHERLRRVVVTASRRSGARTGDAGSTRDRPSRSRRPTGAPRRLSPARAAEWCGRCRRGLVRP